MYVKSISNGSQQDVVSIDTLKNDCDKVILIEVPNNVKIIKNGDTNPDEDDGLLNKSNLDKLNRWHWLAIISINSCLAGSLWWFFKVRKAPSSKKTTPSTKSKQPENKQASRFQIGYRWR